MRALRDVIADAYEMRATLEVKRRSIRDLGAALDAKGDWNSGNIAWKEIADFERLLEIVHDMVAYLESVDQAAGRAV